MIALNLEATNPEHIILKDYLEQNASETLAEKINNGVLIEKDGRTLINKKDLTAFMNYACEEAKKQAEKGARFTCIDHATVFGWLTHFFEESSIEGTLFHEDGTEYKPPKAASKPYVKPVTATVAAKSKAQASFFDMFDTTVESVEAEHKAPVPDDDSDKTEIIEPVEETVPVETVVNTEPEISPTPPALRPIGEDKYVDDDGVIHDIKPGTSSPAANNNSIPSVLKSIFGDTLVRR